MYFPGLSGYRGQYPIGLELMIRLRIERVLCWLEEEFRTHALYDVDNFLHVSDSELWS